MTVWSLKRFSGQAHAALDSLLHGVAVYALPAAIGLATLLALVVWDSKYPAGGAISVDLKSVEQKIGKALPVEVLTQFDGQAVHSFVETNLSEQPFWLRFDVRVIEASILW